MSYPRDLVGYGAHPPDARWLVADVLAELHAIRTRRRLSLSLEETMRAAAAPCDAAGRARWERANAFIHVLVQLADESAVQASP